MANIETSIYGERVEHGLGVSNVGEVFRKTSPHLLDDINLKYALRCGHIPTDIARQPGVIIQKRTPETVAHFGDYIAATLGANLQVAEIPALNGQFRGGLAVPFINTAHVEREFQGHGMEVWGVPGRMVDVLKNKANCHELITKLGVSGFQTPEYQIATVSDLPDGMADTLDKSVAAWRQHNITGQKYGVMCRAEESDGSYGGAFYTYEDGKHKVTANGSGEEAEDFETQKEAFQAMQEYMKSTGNERIVISRLMDVAQSPGLSVFLLDGEFHSLGWNGQVQEEGSSACTGTSTFVPENENIKRIQSIAETPTARSFIEFMKQSASALDVDLSKVRGVANVDLMIPGPNEIQYQQKLGNEPKITVAEINPRFTNWTDALLFVLGAEGQTRSIANMQQLIEKGVWTQDKYHGFRDGIDLFKARDDVAELDAQLKRIGTRMLVRMIDPDHHTMGLVFSGDIAKARRELDNLASKI